MNIESYCDETEFGFYDNADNKQIADLLPGMIKKKEKKQYDNTAPVNCSPIQFSNDKFHYRNKVYCQMTIKKSDYHFRDRHNIVLISTLLPEKIKNTVCLNNIDQYYLYENTGDTRSDKSPANVISAEKPEIIPVKSVQAESVQAESVQAESTQAESVQAESTQAESVQAESTQAESTQAESTQAESTQAESIPAEYRPDSDCADPGVKPVQIIAPVLPELPVFRLSAVSPERKHLPLWQHEQEKVSQTICHTGKNQGSPESSRPDYYCSYYFRQKHQPPEPVLIYREKPGRFKLETCSESLNRRLKSIVNINGIDNIDIL